MSWLELDDRILEHPKFIRAVKLAGSDAVHLWLGLRAYCGQLLTDGLIPEDMISEVRGPKEPRRRTAALDALLDVKLLDRVSNGLMMHDFLDWSSSREDVLIRRESARDRQRRSRGGSRAVTRDSDVTSQAVTDPRARGSDPLPSDHPSSPHLSEPGEKSAHSLALSPFRPAREAIPVALLSIPYLAIYDRYPNGDGKLKAARVFYELSAEAGSSQDSLRDEVLAWFDTGVLERHPYAGDPKFRPSLETVLSERRWLDKAPAAANAIPRDVRRGPVAAPAEDDPPFRKGAQQL